jgi:hypothetical protein
VRCGKCPLSTAKELFSAVHALLKVTNLKRFDNQSRVAHCGKYMLSTAKKRFQLIWRAVESYYFPQLRSILYKAVRCGKCILSAANRGFQRGRALVKMASEHLAEAFSTGHCCTKRNHVCSYTFQIISLVPYQTLFTKDRLEF